MSERPSGSSMTSPTPYLLRALYEWICDNQMTPYLRVVVDSDAVVVPTEYVENGVIVLNVRPSAVRGFEIGDDAVVFSARFNGVPFNVFIPIPCVQAIYSRETGQGLVFFEDGAEPERSRSCAESDECSDDGTTRPGGRGKPNLRLVE